MQKIDDVAGSEEITIPDETRKILEAHAKNIMLAVWSIVPDRVREMG